MRTWTRTYPGPAPRHYLAVAAFRPVAAAARPARAFAPDEPRARRASVSLSRAPLVCSRARVPGDLQFPAAAASSAHGECAASARPRLRALSQHGHFHTHSWHSARRVRARAAAARALTPRPRPDLPARLLR
ncbi:hypothetical protein EVAR_59026_1 [Eumeta japonica]|uniref:Uncharacterized protein n=1 Tax=Eumeta variegata TaxID=151549 RepID=A0A4C1ZIS8_EUMVA|nr:hypothetical protein EVAR_59026_1 [Eumeta japonica]